MQNSIIRRLKRILGETQYKKYADVIKAHDFTMNKPLQLENLFVRALSTRTANGYFYTALQWKVAMERPNNAWQNTLFLLCQEIA